MDYARQQINTRQVSRIPKRVLFLLCIAFASIPLPSAAIPWFEGPVRLRCTGTIHVDVAGRKASIPYRGNYVIDFGNRAWCKSPTCSPGLPIDRLRGLTAWLSDHPQPKGTCGAYDQTIFVGDDLTLRRAFGSCGEDYSLKSQCIVDRISAKDSASAARTSGRLITGLYKIAHRAGSPQIVGGYLLINKNGKMTVYTGIPDKTSAHHSECYVLARSQDVDALMQEQTLRPGKAPGGEPDHEFTVGNTRVGIVDRLSAYDPVTWFYSGPHGNYELNGGGYFVNTGARGTTFSDAPGGWKQGPDTEHLSFPAMPVGWPDMAELQSWMCHQTPTASPRH